MMKSIAKRLKSRTYWLGILTAASAALPEMRDFLAQYYGIVAVLLGISIAALREVTTNSIGDK